MSSDGLSHIDAAGGLAALRVTPYAAEDVLQQLVENHPDLLAGGQMTPDDPRRWALIRREHGVPDREAAVGSRWSVDRVFVDQDAVPTLVEAKRSSDTRIRREVVGQMLDYAANGVRYWPADDLRAAFEATHTGRGRDSHQEIVELTHASDATVEDFFLRVEDNLRAGRIRMVFVADLVPDELRRITEFLNEQMSPAEVFAVEVKTYRAEGHEDMVIVPTVIGRTGAAISKKAPRSTPDRAALLERSLPNTLTLIDLVGQFAVERGLVVQETPAGALLKTPGRGSVANVYLAGWDSLDVPLQPLRDRGWIAEADRILTALQGLTDKQLTAKNPTMPSADAVTNWEQLKAVLADIADLYLASEA